MQRRLRSGAAVLGGAGVLVAGISLVAGSAGAVHEVVIEYQEAFGEPGEVIEIASEAVEPFLQGSSCGIEIEVDNNESVHRGNDVVITSGTDSVVIADVEREPGVITLAEGELVFGDTVVASIRLGEDGVTSGGIRVDFVCDEVPPTTTEVVVAPTTTEVVVAPSSTAAVSTTTTTTTSPPAAAVEAQAAVAAQAQPDFTG